MAGQFKPGDMVAFQLNTAIKGVTFNSVGKVLAEETPGQYRVETELGIAVLIAEGFLGAAQGSSS